ncbi:MAG: hypothetical protein WKG00_04975 [Polyangiaceae bacterium]
MRTPATLFRDSRGAGLVEYILLVGLVSLMALAGFRSFGSRVTDKASAQADCITRLACDPGAVSAIGTGESAIGSESGTVAPADGAGQGEDAGGGGSKSILGRVWGFGKGFVMQGVTMFTETFEIITHPVDTAKALWFVVRHPVATFGAAKDAIVAAWNENPEDLAGRLTWEIVSLPFIAGKLSKLKVVTATKSVIETSKVATTTVRIVGGVRQVAEYGCRTAHTAEAGELAEEQSEVEPHDHAAGTDESDPGTPSTQRGAPPLPAPAH